MEKEDIEYWLDKPAAVQLRVPVILIDAARTEQMDFLTVKGGDGKGYGAPMVVTHGDRTEHSNILVGVLRKTGDRLIMSVRLPSGARIETLLKPDLIDYITLVTEVPQVSRIVQ